MQGIADVTLPLSHPKQDRFKALRPTRRYWLPQALVSHCLSLRCGRLLHIEGKTTEGHCTCFNPSRVVQKVDCCMIIHQIHKAQPTAQVGLLYVHISNPLRCLPSPGKQRPVLARLATRQGFPPLQTISRPFCSRPTRTGQDEEGKESDIHSSRSRAEVMARDREREYYTFPATQG